MTGQRLAELGEQLFRWLDGATDRWLAEAQARQQPITLYVDAPERLRALPWELTYAPEGQPGVAGQVGRAGFVAVDRTAPVSPVRSSSPRPATVRSPGNRPLRVLFMASSPVGVSPVLAFEDEEARILTAATGRAEVVVEESGSLSGLARMLTWFDQGYFDVVHLSGHAMIDKTGQPRFVMEDEVGRRVDEPVSAIADAVQWRWPALLFVSAASTSASSRSPPREPPLGRPQGHVGAAPGRSGRRRRLRRRRTPDVRHCMLVDRPGGWRTLTLTGIATDPGRDPSTIFGCGFIRLARWKSMARHMLGNLSIPQRRQMCGTISTVIAPRGAPRSLIRHASAMVMHRLPRKPARLDGLELFRQLDDGTAGGSVGDPGRIDAVLDLIRIELLTALSTPSTLHGWRAQALFASLVQALDGCQMLTTLDSGEVFVDGDPVKLPDYLVVLRDGRRLLIDVKAIGPARVPSAVTLSAREMAGLRRYAELAGGELYVACVFAGLATWSFLPASAFEIDDRGRRYSATFKTAMTRNELGSTFGDVMIGLVPPIRFDFVADSEQPNHIDENGEATFTVASTRLVAGGQQMETREERHLAMFMLLYGQWQGHEEVIITEDRKVERISFVCEPDERVPGQGFEIIGSLSQMYARWFDAATLGPDNTVTHLQAHLQPGALRALLPEDFSSPRLRLWRFHVRPASSSE